MTLTDIKGAALVTLGWLLCVGYLLVYAAIAAFGGL